MDGTLGDMHGYTEWVETGKLIAQNIEGNWKTRKAGTETETGKGRQRQIDPS